MRVSRILFLFAVVAFLNANDARAGSLTCATLTRDHWDWSLSETWTTDTQTVSLTFSGTGAFTSDLAAYFGQLLSVAFPSTVLSHTLPTANPSTPSSGTTTSAGTTTGTDTTTSTSVGTDPATTSSTSTDSLPPAPVSTTSASGDPTTTTTTTSVPSSSPPIAPVPEPSTVGMALTGLAALGFLARRSRTV